jgi:hypothetical protein
MISHLGAVGLVGFYSFGCHKFFSFGSGIRHALFKRHTVRAAKPNSGEASAKMALEVSTSLAAIEVVAIEVVKVSKCQSGNVRAPSA